MDDLADGILHLLQLESPPDWANIGSGEEVSIRRLAELVAETVGYTGAIVNDLSKPDGTPRKLSDISTIRSTGWEPKVLLRDGLKSAYQDFLSSLSQGVLRE